MKWGEKKTEKARKGSKRNRKMERRGKGREKRVEENREELDGETIKASEIYKASPFAS